MARPALWSEQSAQHSLLRMPAHRVDPSAVGWWRAKIAIITAAVVVVLAAAAMWIEPVRGFLLVATVVAGVTGMILTVLIPRWRYRIHRWEITDEAVYAVKGWFLVEGRVAPTMRIQTIDSSSGPLERAFGLATLVVTTASSRGPIRLEGLQQSTCNDLIAHLVRIAQLERQDVL